MDRGSRLMTLRWWPLAVAALVAGCGTTAASREVEPTSTTVLVSTLSTPAEPSAAVSSAAEPDVAELSQKPASTMTAGEPGEEVRAPIVLGFAGDTTLTDGLDQRDPFGEVVDLLQAPDLMVVNLETTVADAGVGRPPVDKRFLFKSPPASLDLVVDAGIDVVALANNHTLDFGVDGLAQTLEEIDARSLGRVGAGMDEASAYAPLIVDVGDWTIGLLSFSRVPCDWSASGENVRPQVAWACPTLIDRAEAATSVALDEADVVVVMIHGGEEGELCPSPFMVELENTFADMGVDAVINGHPHVLQGLTRRAETWIAHSLGNFAFPAARGITGNSAILQLHISEDDLALSVVPIRSDGGVLSIPTVEQSVEILAQVTRHSQGVSLDDDGSVRVDDGNVGTC